VGSLPAGAALKVGLFIYGSLDTLTGGFLYDRLLVEHLRARGDRVEILSVPWRTYPAHLADNLSAKLLQKLVEARVDVLVQDELNHPSLFLLNQRLRMRVPCPIVSIVHHLRSVEARPAWQNSLYRIVERRYLATLDGFVFNSRTTQCAVQALVGAHKRSVVAYPGGDRVNPEMTTTAIRTRALEPGPLRLLFVGSLIPRKELHTLITALALLPRDTARLEVVGSLTTDSEYAGRIQRQIAVQQLEQQVTLLGTVTGDELERLYENNHVMVVPSSYEGFGIVYLEAMGFGMPAIGSTAGAAHEIITDGIDGFLVEPGNPDELAAHILRLSTDRETLCGMGLAALARYKKHPTWSESCGKIATFLDGMVR
jgi:glycosyltransferase involved in cell wall biosynthesis